MVRNDQKVRAENKILCTDWLLAGPVPAFLLSDRRRTNGEEVVDKGCTIRYSYDWEIAPRIPETKDWK